MKKILASLFLIFAFAGTSFGFEEIFVEEKPPVAETEMNNEQKPAVEVAFDSHKRVPKLWIIRLIQKFGINA